MPQNDHAVPGSLRIFAEDLGQNAAQCRIQSIRSDIWIGMVPNAEAAQTPLYALSDVPVLAIAFRVPRTGKGGEDMLPAGSLCLFPPGENALPALTGRGILLCITTLRLKAILGPDEATLPEPVRALLCGNGANAECILVPLTPEQVLAGNMLIQSPYEGAVRNMLYKSKVLELLALFFGQVALRGHGGMAHLSPADRDIVARAREFLLLHMEYPPSVAHIARHVAVNETKLKRLFKEAYGLSPYACLRRERLAAAREMLLTRGMSVSEAAINVGYTNISHFIDAFAGQYGIRPGELRRRERGLSPIGKKAP